MRRVFVLEDDPIRIDSFQKACVQHELTLTDHLTGPNGACALYQPPYDIICLDHDLGGRQMVDSDEEETGAAFVRWMPVASEDYQPSIIIHSFNTVGQVNMARILRAKGYDRVLTWPFSTGLLDVLRGA